MSETVAERSAENPHVVRVGLIADVQHADIENATSPYGRVRHYRDAPRKCELAAKHWRDAGCMLAVNLGDTVDRRAGAGASAALERVLAAFADFTPVLHILGNHDLSALSADDLQKMAWETALQGLDVVSGGPGYCDITVGLGWHIIALDSYEISVRRDEAIALELRQRLLQDARRDGGHRAHLAEHPELNGAVSEAQLRWLRTRLELAAKFQERAVVVSHAGFVPEIAVYGDALCWNYSEVFALLEEFSHVAVAVIAGHDHYGGEFLSGKGVYHRVLEAAMEGQVGTPTHAILELYDDRICIVGSGGVSSWERSVSRDKKHDDAHDGVVEGIE